MNIATLATILVIAAIAALFARLFAGFTLAGILATYLLACLGAVGGWVAQQQLGLPDLYTFPFPSDGTPVAVVWPGAAALLAALLGGRLWRPRRASRRRR
ncbi:MAG: hypothetical protein AVDCRST_MAG26-1298 [uncultured Chloroflexia bacterium]|uniref:GlsB/YeaQ/YmgE family stress response membrane protein n=1 Tax=uncultured Chloroflexia bacterium TaxID=1672391 RepID=A0A6J4I0H1_9CHLR|nr:MAG: hypothetical protein AVDCRST_MAG26-1298 [uncultured Chloroflexia bacterium]